MKCKELPHFFHCGGGEKSVSEQKAFLCALALSQSIVTTASNKLYAVKRIKE